MNRASIVLFLGVIAFGVTLAIYVGAHLSDETMSVLTGVVCGVGAVLPAVVITALVLARRRDREDLRRSLASYPPPGGYPPGGYPPIIVVTPPTNTAPQAGQLPYMSPPSAPRQFTVIGEEPPE